MRIPSQGKRVKIYPISTLKTPEKENVLKANNARLYDASKVLWEEPANEVLNSDTSTEADRKQALMRLAIQHTTSLNKGDLLPPTTPRKATQ